MKRDLRTSGELRLEGVGRRYRGRYGLRGRWVLRGVDLVVAPGTLVRVQGANGVGKSTLLKLLAGIDAPTEGRISGRPRTAYVPERFPAVLPFTAADYLIHLGAVHGLSRPAAADAADEWLERFGAAEYADTPLSELSKGSSQKVAVAQALLAESALLVLDEAWTGLDAAARAELDRVVTERLSAGTAVVFTEHDPGRLGGVTDATYEIVDGSVEARAPEAGSGPRLVIEAEGPVGATPPADAVAPAALVEHLEPGRLLLTVPESGSDEVLHALLTARPAWHVVTVAREPSVRAEHRGLLGTEARVGADAERQGPAGGDARSGRPARSAGPARFAEPTRSAGPASDAAGGRAAGDDPGTAGTGSTAGSGSGSGSGALAGSMAGAEPGAGSMAGPGADAGTTAGAAADSGTSAGIGSGAGRLAGAGPDVGSPAEAGAGVGRLVDAEAGAGAGIGRRADAEADVGVGSLAEAGAGVGATAGAGAGGIPRPRSLAEDGPRNATAHPRRTEADR